MNACTTLAEGGLAARFGEAFTDQSYDASPECGAELEPAASSPKGIADQQHAASKAIAAFPYFRTATLFNLVLEARP